MSPASSMEQPQKIQETADSSSLALFQCIICQEEKLDAHSLCCNNKHAMCAECGNGLIATQLSSGAKTLCPLCRFEFNMEEVDNDLSPSYLRVVLKQLRPKLKELAQKTEHEQTIQRVLLADLASSNLTLKFKNEIEKSIQRRLELKNFISLNQEKYSIRRGLIYRFENYLLVAGCVDKLFKCYLSKTSPTLLSISDTTINIVRPILSIESILNEYQLCRANLEEINQKKQILVSEENENEMKHLRMNAYKKIYKRRILTHQIILPSLLALAAGSITQAIGMYTVDTKWSMRGFLYESLCWVPLLNRYFSEKNQQWHLENKPRLPGKQTLSIGNGQIPLVHIFELDHKI